MPSRQDPLDKFREVDARYQAALARTDELQAERDDALLDAGEGTTVRALASATGLSPGRVQQILARARARRNDPEFQAELRDLMKRNAEALKRLGE